MIPGLRRRLAIVACRVLQGTLPPRLRAWGDAVESEIAQIADDGGALAFALGSLAGLMPRILVSQIARAANALAGIGLSRGSRRPCAIGIACATGAVLLGIGHMAAAGAPSAYLAVNAAALMIGMLAIHILDTTAAARISSRKSGPGVLALALAVALLATALLGLRVDGAARWISLGGLPIQPSLILLPAMIVAFARSRDTLSAVAIAVAAAALALQPDRAMAGMLTAGLAALAWLRPDRRALAALAAGVTGLAVALVRPEPLPAAPQVDPVLAGAAVLGGSFLLILPAILGARHDPANRHVHVVFGTVWLSALAAAAIGGHPAPVVGYGGSAIVGYLLSLAMLPGLKRSAAVDAAHDRRTQLHPSDRRLRLAPACRPHPG